MPSMPIRWLVLALLLVSAPSGADRPSSEARARLAALLSASPETIDESFLRAARERAAFCMRCHGEDGNSVMPLVPNLAGQNAYYLLAQIERFASGQRSDFIMTPLARQFAPDDRAAVALYFARQRPRPVAADPALRMRGEARFREQRRLPRKRRAGRGAPRTPRRSAPGIPAPSPVCVSNRRRRGEGQRHGGHRRNPLRRGHRRARSLSRVAAVTALSGVDRRVLLPDSNEPNRRWSNRKFATFTRRVTCARS